MDDCQHVLVRWMGFADGVYRLYCAICGTQIGNRGCYVPGTLDIFTNPSFVDDDTEYYTDSNTNIASGEARE